MSETHHEDLNPAREMCCIGCHSWVKSLLRMDCARCGAFVSVIDLLKVRQRTAFPKILSDRMAAMQEALPALWGAGWEAGIEFAVAFLEEIAAIDKEDGR